MKLPCAMKANCQAPFSLGGLAILGMMIAVLEVSKAALSFLPGVEIVTLLVILFTRAVGRRAYLVVGAFVGIECFLYGLGLWTLMYLYIWPLLVTLALAFQNQTSPLFFSIFSGIFGLVFGMLCAIPYLFLGGLHTAVGWWIAGIPVDLVHGITNFLLCLLLFRPLSSALTRLCRP